MNSASWNRVREEFIVVGVSAAIYGLKHFLERRYQDKKIVNVETQEDPPEPPPDHDQD